MTIMKVEFAVLPWPPFGLDDGSICKHDRQVNYPVSHRAVTDGIRSTE